MTSERVGIVVPAKDEPGVLDGTFIDEVLKNVPTDLDPAIFLVVSGASDEFTTAARNMGSYNQTVNVIEPAPGLARAYLTGYKAALETGNIGMVIEMDANGSHKPSYIPDFLDPLRDGKTAALSTRFSQGGNVKRYPLQRRLISQGGTILANLTLGLGQYVPDMTSGYEAFNSDLLRAIFVNHPIDSWISVVKGPGHFVQTELRAAAIWNGAEIQMVPITWGSERTQDPVKLPLRTVLKAFRSLLELRKLKGQFTR